MTQSFPCSRLAEIAEAAPVEPVSFPSREETALLKRTLQKIRKALRFHGEAPGPRAEARAAPDSQLGVQPQGMVGFGRARGLR